MYSGLTLTRFSGRLMGAHQKIDRVSRRHLKMLLGVDEFFPSTKQILHFEGTNGPDGLKRKSPGEDEPLYFLNPLNDSNQKLFKMIEHHYAGLVKALRQRNREQAAFQAAWLAHTLVDGLTPAHHFPYEEKLLELRKGESADDRKSIKEKWIMKGDTSSEKLANNWKAWGPRGLFMAHGLFELGFSAIIKPLRFPDARPDKADLAEIQELGPVEYFARRAREVVMMDLFDLYIDKGWTGTLSRKIRQQLAPLMVKTITLTWYQACLDSGQGL